MPDWASRWIAKYSLLNRGRRSVAFDLKKPEAIDAVLKLVEKADALIEGFRPGVMERLGLGPRRMPQAQSAPDLRPHDRMGPGGTARARRRPRHQLHRADGRAAQLSGARARRRCRRSTWSATSAAARSISALGVVAGLLEAQKSGKGQVVDAAMVDGAASLMTAIYGMHASGFWNNERGDNILDTGAHYYDVYETKDGKYVAIGSIEAKFYAELLRLSGLEGRRAAASAAIASRGPTMKERLTTLFRTKTRDEWCKIMEGSDICFAPVLSMAEAPSIRITSIAGPSSRSAA